MTLDESIEYAKEAMEIAIFPWEREEWARKLAKLIDRRRHDHEDTIIDDFVRSNGNGTR